MTLIADSPLRDVQSSRAFASGLFGAECAGRADAVHVAPHIAADRAAVAGCAPADEAEVMRETGGNLDAVTQLYAKQLHTVAIARDALLTRAAGADSCLPPLARRCSRRSGAARRRCA